MSEDEKERLIRWNTFFRENPQYFVEWFLGITLFEYQRFWLYVMQHSTRFLALAGRGTAKSFIVAIFALMRAILYPGTTIVLASKTKKQAGLIVTEKIALLREEHPNVAREIKKIITNANDYQVDFHNGSRIFSVVSSANSRGYRAHVLVVDESRQVPTEILDTVLKNFLVLRKPKFSLQNKEYSDYVEQPVYIQITSVGYKGEEWHQRANQMLLSIAKGSQTVKVLFFDYLVTLKHHIRSREQIVEDKEDMDDIFFQMELGNRPFGGSRDSYYQYQMFKCNLTRPWIPIKFDPGIPKQKNKYDIPRAVGEKRLVSVDIALAAGEENDLSSISCYRMLPSRKGYKSPLVYMETISGGNIEEITLRIKQIYSEFTGFSDGDMLVLDIQNAGRGVYDLLTSVTTDDERGIDYPPMSVMMHPSIKDEQYQKLLKRKRYAGDAHECIYPIAASAQLNSDIATVFRIRLKNGLLQFLVDANEQEEIYIRKKNKDIISPEDPSFKSYVLSPNVQTSLMINEAISLDLALFDGGKIRLKEKSGRRKDRYTSSSYGNYVISIFDSDILQDDGDADELEVWLGALAVV